MNVGMHEQRYGSSGALDDTFTEGLLPCTRNYRHPLNISNHLMNFHVLLWPVANVMSFLIFWRRKCMLSKSSALYLMAIAVADTAVLLFIVVLELSVKYYTVEPFWSREPWCSMRDVFNYGAFNASTWLVVAFTAERFLAITTWSYKNWICNPRCALWVICLIFLVGHLLAVPYYWAYISIYSQEVQHWLCIYRPDSPIEYALAMVSLQTTLSHILPFIFIGVLNGLTLRQIALSSRVHVAAETSGHKVAPLLRSRKRKSVVLLVTVSMTFVLLSITRSITQLLLHTNDLHVDRDDYSLDINVAADIGTMLSLTNAAVNMYLYACTQARFRQEVMACFKLCLWRGCLVRTSPSSCVPGRA
ncbi:hypothetical protein NFI96_011581 [Prochilodus magdalenae]|nr:hypothetical protein NFI96_011581 [Prochilodus magdalenae]